MRKHLKRLSVLFLIAAITVSMFPEAALAAASGDSSSEAAAEAVTDEQAGDTDTIEVSIASDDADTEEILYGDLNKDGAIDSDDVTVLRTAISQKLTEGYEQGDVNGDGKLSTLDISLINQYIAGTITYFPVGDVYQEGVSWMTRGEWIYQLVTIYEMSVEDESSITEYFTDLDDYEYADAIELAANIGVFAVDEDEFSPDDYVTREFAAHTMNYCAGYIEDMDVYPADLSEIYYAYDAQVAVAQGWLELVDKEFRKDLYVTATESANMLEQAVTLAQKTEIDEDYEDQVTYKDDVLMVDEDITVSVSDDTVTIESDDVIILAGEVFGVTVDGEQHFYVAESVSYDKNGYSVVQAADAEIEEYVDALDIQGYGEVDYDNVESLYDGVDVETDTTVHTSSDSISPASVSVNDGTISLSGTIDLGDGVKATVSGSISDIIPSYAIKFNGTSLESFYFNVDADADISASLSGSWSGTKSKEVNLASIPVVNAGLLAVNIKVVFTISASGTISVDYAWDVQGGIQYTDDDGWRVTKSFQKKSASVSAECSESLAAKLLADVELGTTTLGEIYVMGGEKGTLSAKTQDDDVVCTTLKAYLFAEVGASLNIFSKSFSKSYQFVNAGNSPLKITRHWEDGVAVDACTYETDSESFDDSTSDTSRSSYQKYGIAFDGIITSSTSAESRADTSVTEVTSDTTLSGDVVVTGSLWVTGGTLDLNGHTLTVYGDVHHTGGTILIDNGTLDIEGDYRAYTTVTDNTGETSYESVSAHLKMTQTKDSMKVAGDFYWYGYGYSSYLTAGTLTIGGDFTDYRTNSYCFKASGTHRLVLNGTEDQEITTAGSSNATCFNEVEVENIGSHDIVCSGYLEITEMETDISVKSAGLTIAGMDVNGNTVTVKGDVEETGSIDVNAGVLNVTGSLTHTAGTLTLNNGTVNITGDYIARATVTDNTGETSYESVSAHLKMTQTKDSMKVAGDFYWYGYGYSSYLTAGTLTIGGDFTDYRTNSYCFKASGSHKTILNGASDQTVTMASTDSCFNILELTRSKDTYTFSHEPCWNTLIVNEHSYDEAPSFTWYGTSAATATFTCSDCGETLDVVADITEEVTEATCTSDGKITYTATVTQDGNTWTDTKEETLAATGHSYKSEITKAATSTETGVRTYVCENCGDTYTEIIPALGETGQDTLMIRRGSTFYLINSEDGSTEQTFTCGESTDEVLIGDWDGDGYDTICLRSGNTYYFSNTLGGDTEYSFSFGKSTDEVLVGDWDGNGIDTLCLRRGSTFYISNSADSGTVECSFTLGEDTDEILVGDWDGDGVDTLSIRSGNVFYIYNILGGEAEYSFSFGKKTDSIIVGDWDGDGTDGLCLRRGSACYISNDPQSGVIDTSFSCGQASDEVYAGTWGEVAEQDVVPDTLGLRRGNTFYISYSLEGTTDLTFTCGKDTDEILVGDWDGDGLDTICLRRGNRYYFSNTLGGEIEFYIDFGKSTDEVF
ncbi:MAG: dockerin type I repeat-containing protein, partial [Clostridiales bacterium]|nr:dockerin type I repeat-containing protein [Clostridiales bacterium]